MREERKERKYRRREPKRKETLGYGPQVWSSNGFPKLSSPKYPSLVFEFPNLLAPLLLFFFFYHSKLNFLFQITSYWFKSLQPFFGMHIH
jgi:hypothetical protein